MTSDRTGGATSPAQARRPLHQGFPGKAPAPTLRAVSPGFDATLDERVERHLLGDAEWTTTELWEQASACPYSDQRARLLGRLALLLELSPC